MFHVTIVHMKGNIPEVFKFSVAHLFLQCRNIVHCSFCPPNGLLSKENAPFPSIFHTNFVVPVVAHCLP